MLNRVEIQGRLTRDIELHNTNNGGCVASFTIAWSERRGDKEQKTFPTVVAWNKNAEFVSKYFKKGQEMIVEGKLVDREWEDREGNRRVSREIILDKAHFAGKKETTNNRSESYFQSFGTDSDEDMEDDLPF